mgnify:FL=1|tara:strand:+ start:2381 stop:3454 length:1074 start_codon:yes stop_codon:yes gene_type:complete
MKLILIALFSIIVGISSHSQCYSAGQNVPSAGYLLKSSGHPDLDKIVNEEIYKLQLFFGVKIDFFFLKELYNGKNAMFTSSCNYNCNGTILLGVNLLYDRVFTRKHGVECVKAVLAHEFGHCIQKLQYWNEPGKRPELHADYMAGFYMGSSYNHTDSEVNALFNEFFSIGGYEYWSPDYHGSPGERKCAFLEGYYFARENKTNASVANSYGLQYVTANNPCGVRKYKAAVQSYQNEIQRRTAQLERDVKNNNVGSIRFQVKDNKKYSIVTTDGRGVQVTYPFNQSYIGVNNYGQRVMYPPNRTVDLYPISANTNHQFAIYRNTFLFGNILMYTYATPISKGKTVKVDFSKKNFKITF